MYNILKWKLHKKEGKNTIKYLIETESLKITLK